MSWSTAQARTPRSRGKGAPPGRRLRSTASSICAIAVSRRAASHASASSRSRDTSWSASAPSLATALDRVALLLATVFGAGYAPVAPGTVASALTVLVLWLVPFSRPWLVVFLVAVTVAGTWAAHRAERAIGTKDPGAIVIDEVAGMTLSVAPFVVTPAVLVVAFVLFRIFDVTKPFLVGASPRIT